MSHSIWLVQAGERLPIDGEPRLMRMGMVADELHRRGHSVRWFSARFDHAKKTQRSGAAVRELREGYTLHLLEGCSYSRNLSPARILHQHQVATNLQRAAQELQRPDLIISAHPTPDLSSTAARLAQALRVPFILDIRDPWPDMFPGYFSSRIAKRLLSPLLSIYRSMLRTSASQADALLAVSESMLTWGLTYAGRARRDSDTVFPIGYPSVGTPHTELHTPIECVFVSTFGQSYDSATVIEAFRALGPASGLRCTFVGDGEQRASAERLAQGLENVRFTGWLGNAELHKLLLRMDVGFISVRGGISSYMLPNKLFEYLSYGLAIVNTLPQEAAQLLRRSESGATFVAGDVQGLCSILREWSSKPEQLRRTRQNAITLFNEEFRAESIYRRYCDLAEQYLQRTNERKYLQV